MATRSLGALTLDLVAKTGAFITGMTAAERSAQKTFGAIEKRAKAFGTALGTAVTVAAGALVALTKSAIDNADALRDSSIQLGISTETLSAYGYAAQQTGTDLDGLSRGLKILSKNAADAIKPTSEQAKIFDALGIAVTTTDGQLRKLDDLIPDIADAFRNMEDGTQKAALAQALFGKSGLELTEFLNSGSRGLDEFTAKAKELGIIVGTDTANAADEFNDKLADLKALVAGFGNELAAELLPRLIELIDYFNEAAKSGTTLGTTVKDIGSLFDIFTDEVKKADEVGNSLRQTFGLMSSSIHSIDQAFKDLFKLNIKGFFKGLSDSAISQYEALKASFGIKTADFSGVSSYVSGRRAQNARGGSNRTETGGRAIDYAALSGALAGVTDPRVKGSKAAKEAMSEEEKAAERLAEQYKTLIASLDERTALIGAEGEAAKLSYDLQFGELSKLTQAEKDIALAKAQKYDTDLKVYELAQDMRRMQERDLEFAQQALEDLQFETELLGKTREEQEKLNLARQLGTAAATEQGKAAVKALEDYQAASDAVQQQVDVLDAGRGALKGLTEDIYDGVSAIDALKNAFGRFADQLFDLATDAVIKQFFGQMGSTNTGSAGNSWLSLLGSIFGPSITGFAKGGWVPGNSLVEVNESGLEMATVGGRDYMLTGPSGAMVTPNHKLGGVNQSNQFIFAAPTSQRTQEQIASRIGYETAQAQRRNG